MISAQKLSAAQAKAQLAKTVIRAPFTGVIDEVAERGMKLLSQVPEDAYC
jgi:multidrug resistance efflux pump